MSTANSYLLKLYLKHTAVTLGGLELFFLLIDFLQNQKNIPDSANLVVLYFYYQAFAALKITLVLSLVFAAIWSFVYLVRSNELTAFEAIGYSKKKILIPFFLSSLLLSSMFLLSDFTPLGYYKQNAESIIKKTQTDSRTADLFFRFKDEYIYISKLNPLSKSAENVKIITQKKDGKTELLMAKNAYFKESGWLLKDAYLTEVNEGGPEFVSTKKVGDIETLEGFKPKILDNISKGGEGLNSFDAIEALWLLKEESLSLEKIKASLFVSLSMPFFAPFFVVFIWYYLPISSRSFASARFASVAIFASLLSWGVLMAVSKLSVNGPLGAYIMPIWIALFGGISLYLYKKGGG